MAYFALHNEKSICVYIAPTGRQAKMLGFQPMMTILPSVVIRDIAREPGNFSIKLINGSVLYFRSAEARDQVLRGEYVDYLELDEVDYFVDGEYLWDSVLRPAMIDHAARVLALSSPDSEGGLISRFFEDWGKLPDGLAVQLKTADNPYLDPEEIAAAAASMDDITYRRELLGEPIGYSGLCLSCFSAIKNTLPRAEFPQILPGYRYVAGLDYGAVDPTVVVYGFLDYGGQCWIYDEFYQPCETLQPLYLSLRAHAPHAQPGARTRSATSSEGFILYYDSAHPGVAAELRVRGLGVLEKPVKDVRIGIQRVNEWFSDGRLHIASECNRLLDDITHYRWRQTRTGQRLDEPEHSHSHGCDALRYLIASLAPSARAIIPQAPTPYFSVAALDDEIARREHTQHLLRASGLRMRGH